MMDNHFEDLLKEASGIWLSKEISDRDGRTDDVTKIIDLMPNQENKLKDKILLLPEKWQFVLFGKYCFYFTHTEIEFFFEIEKAKGHISYYREFLSIVMELEEGHLISEITMKHACKAALNDYMEKEFYNNKKDGKNYRAIRPSWRRIGRRIAIAAIITTMTFSTIVVSNAEFREKVLSWVMEVFEKYSIFELKNEDEVTIGNLQNYVPTYIPKNFELVESVNQPSLTVYKYCGENDTYIEISMTLADTKVYIDTEGVHMEESKFNGMTSYYFEKDALRHFIFQKDGYSFVVYGTVDKDEIIKIAENIEFQK